VTEESPEAGPLAALGRVDPPPPAVLDAAREVLWSAVAREMLATGPASGQVTGADRSESAADHRADRRNGGRAGQPPDPGA
jgi:hypothetical protein